MAENKKDIEVSIVLPTFNECDNIKILLPSLEKTLSSFNYELFVIDDNSQDGTLEFVYGYMQNNVRVSLLSRKEKRGLSSAILEGFQKSSGKYIVVMNTDLQHDEHVLPQFIEKFREGNFLVLGTRNKVLGGLIQDWSLFRRFTSFLGSLLASLVLNVTVSDPMSGFFGISRTFLEKVHHKINPLKFKLLLNFLMYVDKNMIGEVGYTFSNRRNGKSKLNSFIILEYLITLIEIRFSILIPLTFLKYILVGLFGLGINLVSQFILQKFVLVLADIIIWGSYVLKREYLILFIGMELSLLSNFFLNNRWTFNSNKLFGFQDIAKGLLFYHLFCSIGVIINFFVCFIFFEYLFVNIYIANLLGILCATFWNYKNSIKFWKK